MNLPILRVFGLPLAGVCVAVACGGKAVIDGGNGSGGATGTGGATSSSSSATAGGCDSVLHTIHANDFDASCTVEADCVPVFIGDLCGKCLCPNTFINATAKAKYQAERDAKAVPPMPGGCFCPAVKPTCAQGHCSGP